MNDRTIDLTVSIPPQFRVLLVTLGVIHVLGGALFLSGGSDFFGILNLVLGPSWLSWGLFYERINRHAIAIDDGQIEIVRGLFRRRRIPWPSIAGIRFESTRMDIQVTRGKAATVNFREISPGANRLIRDEMITKLSPVAEANGVSIEGV
ncbi:MAG: PH domain-containing protein [Gemmatimonadota bacterium]|nr:PH domain-containing protein [Gemmatimonadota bacterium]